MNASELAKKYKIPKKIGKRIEEHFDDLDNSSKGFLTKEDVKTVMDDLNPLSPKVLDAFFYPPEDLDPGAKPLDTVDLEHFFQVIHLFFLFSAKQRTWKDCKDLFMKPKKVFRDSEDRRKKRLMILFRILKEKDEVTITKEALSGIVGLLKIKKASQEFLEKAFEEVKVITKSSLFDFEAFLKLCSKYQIDELFINEVRDTNDKMLVF